MKRMKTILSIGILLTSLNALASPSDPAVFQYWLDADQQSRVRNTQVYNGSSNQLSVDVGNLSEGGHALHSRMAIVDGDKVLWGRTMSKYFHVSSAPDASTSGVSAYRLIINSDIVDQGTVSGSSFTLNPEFPESIVLASVSDRSFKFLAGEKKVSMTANGVFSYAVQLMSDKKEWGAPLIKEISDQITTKLPYDSITVPERYSFEKVDNNNFKAFRFKNNYSDCLYITPSQDCRVTTFNVSESFSGNLGYIESYELFKGVTTRVGTGYAGSDIIAIFFDTSSDKDNNAANIALDIMLEDHKMPKPIIRLDPDSWELSITCPDQRATIFYTLDGSHPTTASTVYTGPVELDRFTRVRAFAVLDGYEDSEEEDMQFGANHMRIPSPELKYAGGLEKNEFVFTNRVDDVIIYYTLGLGSDLDDESLRILFDGNPFKIENGEFIQAYAVKDNLAPSEILSQYVYLNDYVTPSPDLGDRMSEGEDYDSYSDRIEKIRLSVPEGTAYYRCLLGNQTFNPSEEINKESWIQYNPELNNGWIDLPGGANSGNQTVQVFAESEGKATSAVTDIYTDWVRAKQPRIDYNNYHLKLSTDVPGGVIKYNFGYYSPDEALVYSEDEFPQGLNVEDQWLVTAFVEADGYNTSNARQINRDYYNLDRPQIQYQDDGYLHITHEDEEVDLIVEIMPSQSVDTIAANDLRFIPEYNTTVSAYAVKHGRNNSQTTEKNPYYQPTIHVDGYRVWIDSDGYGNIYYTTDGQKPTKESDHYQEEFFVDKACTIRAVSFYDGEIPSEAVPVRVLDQTATPDIIFNYSTLLTEGGPIESKKIKFNCSTDKAKIYYSLEGSLTDESRKLYDPSTDPDGVDVGDNEYVYAYAEAEDYRRSLEVSRYLRDGYLSSPEIRVEKEEVIISHRDPSVTIVPIFSPAHEYTYVHDGETNTITCKVKPNTTVSATVEKSGYLTSPSIRITPTPKPVVYVDGTDVYMEYSEGEIYFTLDGSEPTKESTRYSGRFNAEGATVRTVKFEDDYIPSSADPVLIAPVMKVTDGVVEISHKDPAAKIVPVFTPAQEYTKDGSSNRLTCKVAYNTTVAAHVEKEGCNPSAKTEITPVDKPQINVDGNYVWISNTQGEGDIFYTLDGAMPTKDSKLYEEGFETKACKIRAVCFVNGRIPAEADPASVMNQAEIPEIVFNFSRTMVDGAPQDSRKVKFTCSTPGANLTSSLLTDSKI